MSTRRKLIELLTQRTCGIREISQELRISEKDVDAHLQRVERTVASQGRTLVIEASQCLSCEFVFSKRKRFTRPSRCPKCKSERISGPTFRIDGASS